MDNQSIQLFLRAGTTDKAKEVVGELMKCHAIADKVGRA
jgi:hypothetical protein